MLKRIVAEQWLRPKAVVGFWPAARDGDDIALYSDEARRDPDRHAPYAAPAARQARRPAQSGARRFRRPPARDYIGGFVVTAGIEDEAIARRFELANDDYSSILVKALADRLAEAFAEAMHARVRRELWGLRARREPSRPRS